MIAYFPLLFPLHMRTACISARGTNEPSLLYTHPLSPLQKASVLAALQIALRLILPPRGGHGPSHYGYRHPFMVVSCLIFAYSCLLACAPRWVAGTWYLVFPHGR